MNNQYPSARTVLLERGAQTRCFQEFSTRIDVKSCLWDGGTCCISAGWVGSSSSGQDPGFLGSNTLNISQGVLLWCWKLIAYWAALASWGKWLILSSRHWWGHIWTATFCTLVWETLEISRLEKMQWRPSRWSGARAQHVVVTPYEDGVRLFSELPSRRTGGNGCVLQQGKFNWISRGEKIHYESR